MTMKAAMPSSRAVLRRHSRRYSRKTSSMSATGLGRTLLGAEGVEAESPVCAGEERRFLRGLLEVAGENHSGRTPHTSHEPQACHFGVSPKCKHTWRWRQTLFSTKRRP